MQTYTHTCMHTHGYNTHVYNINIYYSEKVPKPIFFEIEFLLLYLATMMYQSCEQVSLPYSYRKRQTDKVYNRSAESAIVSYPDPLPPAILFGREGGSGTYLQNPWM